MKTEIIAKLEAHIVAECKQIDREARFDEMLDSCYSFDSVGGPFAHMSPSRVLRECDPIAHRCGVNDYADSESWVEVDGESYDQDEAEKAKESFVEDLESAISDLESEIEEGKADEADTSARERKLHDMQADLAVVNAHSF
jgi:fructose-specific component phosphotransferase system IIB-like protein